MSFPNWVVNEDLENLYVDAQSLGADEAVLSKERTTRRFMETKLSTTQTQVPGWGKFVRDKKETEKDHKRCSLSETPINEIRRNTIGEAFPFVNRKKECKQLVKCLYNGLFVQSREPQQYDKIKKYLQYPIALGLSGIGKTRFGREGILHHCERQLKKFDELKIVDPNIEKSKYIEFMEMIYNRTLNIRVSLDFTHHVSINNYDMEIAQEIIFEWCKYQFTNREDFMSEFLQYDKKSLSIPNVLDILLEYYDCVFINIDEADKGSEYLPLLVTTLGTHIIAKARNVLFFVSGIKCKAAMDALGYSSMIPVYINLPPLKDKHIVKILHKLDIKCNDPYVKYLRWLVGGIPKYLELLLYGITTILDPNDRSVFVGPMDINNYLDSLDIKNFLHILQIIKKLPMISFRDVPFEVFDNLVALSLSQVSISSSTIINTTDFNNYLIAANGKAFTIADAEYKQLVYVNSTKRIQIPPILLSNFYNKSCAKSKMLKMLLSISGRQSSRENEATLPTVIYYRIMALRKFGGVIECSIDELLGITTNSCVIKIDEIKSLQVSKKTINSASMPTQPGLYINTPKAPFADFLFVFEGMIVFGQEKNITEARMKHINKKHQCRPPNINILIEYNKVRSAMKNNDIFLYITDEDERTEQQLADEEILPDNCFVICWDRHPQLFGEMVATLRQFCCSADLVDCQQCSKKRPREQMEPNIL